MRRSIHINQAQMLRRSETEQQVTCAMCLEAITDSTKTTLDSCSHTYCFDCISRWVQEVESICPQCLRPVAQLCRLQTNGSIAETSVRLRRREEEVDNCFACKGIINLADIVMQFREQDQLDSWISSRCKVCSSLCIHTSCMHEQDRGIWQASAEWTCPACKTFLSWQLSPQIENMFTRLHSEIDFQHMTDLVNLPSTEDVKPM